MATRMFTVAPRILEWLLDLMKFVHSWFRDTSSTSQIMCWYFAFAIKNGQVLVDRYSTLDRERPGFFVLHDVRTLPISHPVDTKSYFARISFPKREATRGSALTLYSQLKLGGTNSNSEEYALTMLGS